jgi:hypothetical protein
VPVRDDRCGGAAKRLRGWSRRRGKFSGAELLEQIADYNAEAERQNRREQLWHTRDLHALEASQ